ncbi:hypothetical protein J8F10_09360 [Gemmata sp. G18]|uniref:Uncharacterized protein n=1 Tax=Gemmata palustris TaxID=2822762 RepID=A0ABS5BP35_9BACT|nr:hypothetical protein [Gemmata palustris]MBP3955488.1 hypothetical protein [Gemmata palustris]
MKSNLSVRRVNHRAHEPVTFLAPIGSFLRVPVASQPCDLAEVCPNCGAGRLFLDVNKDGTIEIVCDLCTLFAPTPRSFSATGSVAVNADLPWAVRCLRPSERTVYRVIRDLPGSLPQGIVRELDRRTNDFASRDTVNHAIQRLKIAGHIRRESNGWVVCESTGATSAPTPNLYRDGNPR